MSEPKEPDFFCADGKVESLDEYESLFGTANETQIAIGEASVRYLSSLSSIRAIENYTEGQARYIVMFRNPVEMAKSFHGQRVRSGNEPIWDFQEAWNAQSWRRTSSAWMSEIYAPDTNLYQDFCRIGSQARDLVELVGRKRCYFIFLEDLAEDPRSCWSELQAFLEIPSNPYTPIEKRNQSRVIGNTFFHKFMIGLAKQKRRIGLTSSFGLGKKILRANMRTRSEPQLVSSAFEAELYNTFLPEIEEIERLTQRDLTNWKRSADQVPNS